MTGQGLHFGGGRSILNEDSNERGPERMEVHHPLRRLFRNGGPLQVGIEQPDRRVRHKQQGPCGMSDTAARQVVLRGSPAVSSRGIEGSQEVVRDGLHVCLPILRPGGIETDAAGLQVEMVERELSEPTDPQSCEQGGLVEQPVERSRDRQ